MLKKYEFVSVGENLKKRPRLFTLHLEFFFSVVGTRFGSLELKIGSLESGKVIIGSLESEKSGPYRSIPGCLTFSFKKP